MHTDVLSQELPFAGDGCMWGGVCPVVVSEASRSLAFVRSDASLLFLFSICASISEFTRQCKRLKLKCDRKAPCGSCSKRDTVDRCIYSAAAQEKLYVFRFSFHKPCLIFDNFSCRSFLIPDVSPLPLQSTQPQRHPKCQ